MSKHSEQVMKQRAKLKRVEILFRPADYEKIKENADCLNLSISAYIKKVLDLDLSALDLHKDNKRVELLLRPESYETIETAAKLKGMSIAAYTKLAVLHETIYTANYILGQKKEDKPND